jgi:chemotaxis protein MotA
MISIVGVILLFVCVFGGYVAHGGDMGPIIKAAPGEMFIIGGAGIAGMVSGNSLPIFKSAMGGFGRVVKGPKYKKDDYVAIIAVISKLMKTLKAEGAVAMESHVENPEASAIFGECPKMLHDHGLVGLVCDTIRLMVVSSGTLSPYAVEDVMTTSIKLHHHNEMKSAEALAALSGALPALGIVACVLGVVKTMGAIDQPPPVLGALIGGALVGTFLGVFMAYGIFEPFAQRLKQIILGNMHGYPVPLIIEGARVCISHTSQPTFGELFDALRK